jgi:hypothetical protein
MTSAFFNMQENRRKWRYYPTKKFPWYGQFMELLGISAVIGDYGTCTEISIASGSGISDPDHVDNRPVHDSEERERFDFQETRMQEDECTIEGHREDVAGIGQQPSKGTDEIGNRSTSSNKQRSSEEPGNSRNRRAKKAITGNRATQAGILDAMGHLVRSSDHLVEQNERFIAIQNEKMKLNARAIPQEVVDILNSYGLNIQQRRAVMRALRDPVEMQCFMNATAEEQKETIGEYIPGFFQPRYGGVHPNPATNENPFFLFQFYEPATTKLATIIFM